MTGRGQIVEDYTITVSISDVAGHDSYLYMTPSDYDKLVHWFAVGAVNSTHEVPGLSQHDENPMRVWLAHAHITSIQAMHRTES